MLANAARPRTRRRRACAVVLGLGLLGASTANAARLARRDGGRATRRPPRVLGAGRAARPRRRRRRGAHHTNPRASRPDHRRPARRPRRADDPYDPRRPRTAPPGAHLAAYGHGGTGRLRARPPDAVSGRADPEGSDPPPRRGRAIMPGGILPGGVA